MVEQEEVTNFKGTPGVWTVEAWTSKEAQVVAIIGTKKNAHLRGCPAR